MPRLPSSLVDKSTIVARNIDNSQYDVIKAVSVTMLRADKFLAAQNVANIEYNAANKPTKVQYNSSTDTDYEVFTYNENNKLINVAHYVGGVLQGNTVLSHSNGKLVSAPFIAV